MKDVTQTAENNTAMIVEQYTDHVRAKRSPLVPLSGLVAVLVIVPIASVFWLAFNPDDNIWPHLFETVLWDYVGTTLLLLFGVCLGTFVVGTGCAWLVVMCRFPGRGLFEWMLMLPMAMPAYIVAYAYVDVLEYAGPVQGVLRDLFGWQTARDYWFPQIRSIEGAALVMGFVLYPYVYLLARAAFLNQSAGVFDVARTLGSSPWSMFLRVALPLARPAIVVGLTMVMMETLNDFGTVDYFAVRTLTAGLYDVWLSMDNLGGSAQIACVMLLFVLALIGLEQAGRRGQKFHTTTTQHREAERFHLAGVKGVVASLLCFGPILIGFLMPACLLGRSAIIHFETSYGDTFLTYAANSLYLSLMAGLCALFVGVLLAYAARLSSGPVLNITNRIASVGYAVPGAVLGIGVLIPFAAFDNRLDAFMRETFDLSTGLLLTGSIGALVFAYVVRFLAVSVGTVESGLGRVTPHMDMAARTLGLTPLRTLLYVHLPILKGSLLTALILVFVDGMKELPMTLLLRPFNFETLATHVYTSASLGLLEESALSSLAIVLTGLIPVLLLNHTVSRSHPGKKDRQ